jgi:hypothetical protein
MADRGKRAWMTLALAATAFAARPMQGAGTDSSNFLSIPVGGRPAALGGAYSALAEDAYAPVWNPSGLGFLPATQLSGMHLDYAESIGYEFLSFAHPVSAHDGLGASIQYLHPKTATARDAAGADIGTFSSHYAAYSLAYGHSFNQAFSLGGSLRLVDARISDVSGSAEGVDLGGLYKVSPRVSVAVVAANLGTKMRFLQDSESMPDTYRLGMVFSPVTTWSLAAETAYDRADSTSLRFGAEWRPVPLLAVRLGYHDDPSQNLSGLPGLTTGLGLTALGQRFDYAFAPMGQLGNTQYFSVLFTFGKGEKKL